MSTEIVSKLSPQSCNLLNVSGGRGLTAADVAHACTMTHDIGFYIICIKYSDDKSGYSKLIDMMTWRIHREATRENWKRSRIPGLIKLAIAEYTGTKVLKNKQRAKLLQIDQTVWSRVWRKKYERILTILESYEYSALYLINNRLK